MAFVSMPSDPIERTRFHEAGHTVVYWALYAEVSNTVVATHILDEAGCAQQGGFAQINGLGLQNTHGWGTKDYHKAIAVFLAGKLSVAKAIRCGLLPSLKGQHPDETEDGDAGYYPWGRLTAQSLNPQADSDWVDHLSQQGYDSISQRLQPVGEPFPAKSEFPENGKALATHALNAHWPAVLRIVEAIRSNHMVEKLDLRDILIHG
jgi:hypothetical protein